MTFREYLQQVSDKDLIKAFEEYQELASTGVLHGGVSREFLRKCEEIYGAEFTLNFIEKEVYYEMGRRYYELKMKNRGSSV